MTLCSTRHRTLVILTLLAAVLPSAAPADSESRDLHSDRCMTSVDCEDAACSREEGLFCYLSSNDPGEGTVILALDHRRQPSWWKAYQWQGKKLCELKDEYFELGPEDRPRLNLPKNQELAVYVVDTNPLVYTLTPGESSVAERADLANLKTFVSLLTGTASTALEIGGQFLGLAERTSTTNAVVAAEAMAVEGPSYNPEVVQRRLNAEQIALQDIEDDLDQIKEAMKQSSRTLAKAVDQVLNASRSLDSALKEFERREGEVQSYVRSVEMGAALDPRVQWPPIRAVEDGFQDVLAARIALDNEKPVCMPEIELLHQVIGRKVDGFSSTPTVHRQQKDVFSSALTKLQGTTSCPTLRDPLLEIAEWLNAFPPTSTPDPQVTVVLAPIEKLLGDYLDLVAKRREVITNANKALGERGTVAKAGQKFAILEQRQKGFLAACPTPCSRRYGVLPVSRAQGQDVDVAWDDVRTESFEIAFDETYTDLVIPTRPKKLTGKYELERESWWQDFDIDFGLVYTELVDPEFSAVSIPPAKEEMPAIAATMDDEEMPEPMVISRTDEESRAGDVALFATWVPVSYRSFHFGPQIGLGLDTDKPQLFAGLAFGLGPYVKLSGGWTWQEVKELAGGQEEDVTLVSGDDDIKTRRTFDDDWYVALTISIDNLPFWGEDGGDEE